MSSGDPTIAAVGLVALLAGVVGLICAIVVLVAAFKRRTLDGVLCLLVPLYLIYFAIAKYRSPRRTSVVLGLIGPVVLSLGLSTVMALGMAPKMRKAKLKVARMHVHALRVGAAQWRLEASAPTRCPTINDLVRGKWVSRVAARPDPWGQLYLLNCSGDDIFVRSYGPDGQANTDDDIVASADDDQ